MSFAELLAVVRGHLGRRVDVPRDGEWRVELSDDRPRLVVTLDTPVLCVNMQENKAAAPFFAVCLAWWFEQATGQVTDVEVRVTGEAPIEPNALRHWRRSQFLLAELSAILGPRFRVEPAPSWTWPVAPVLNAPLLVRSLEHDHDPLSEHALEVQIASSASLLASFPEPLAALGRQLPVGLFEGRVADATAWTPGGASQVDLWGCSPDGRVAHLIELKKRGNTQVGILAEALYYGRLLNHLRLGRVSGGGDALAAIGRAERLVVWLVAPDYHPLVFLQGRSPLAWINEGMKHDGVEFRVLPIELDEGGVRRWRTEARWP